MAKITLARAFVLRGFFRKTISELDREIRAEDLTSEIEDSKSFFKDESTEKENDTKLDKPIFDSCTNVQFSKSLTDKAWRIFSFLVVHNHFWRRFNFFQNFF